MDESEERVYGVAGLGSILSRLNAGYLYRDVNEGDRVTVYHGDWNYKPMRGIVTDTQPLGLHNCIQIIIIAPHSFGDDNFFSMHSHHTAHRGIFREEYSMKKGWHV